MAAKKSLRIGSLHAVDVEWFVRYGWGADWGWIEQILKKLLRDRESRA
jgi:hypothetical protein